MTVLRHYMPNGVAWPIVLERISKSAERAELSWALLMMAFLSLYKIYSYKSANHREHFTSYHSQAGLAVIILAVGPALAGTVFLHPDFGIDKTNKLYRKVHKQFARVVITLAWLTAFYGLYSMTTDIVPLALFALPLVVLFPFTLI